MGGRGRRESAKANGGEQPQRPTDRPGRPPMGRLRRGTNAFGLGLPRRNSPARQPPFIEQDNLNRCLNLHRLEIDRLKPPDDAARNGRAGFARQKPGSRTSASEPMRFAMSRCMISPPRTGESIVGYGMWGSSWGSWGVRVGIESSRERAYRSPAPTRAAGSVSRGSSHSSNRMMFIAALTCSGSK